MMKDITAYFTTPRKSESATPANTHLKSPKSNKQPNGLTEKICEKRKLQSESEADDDVTKLKRSSLNASSEIPKFNDNLTVLLTQIDLDVSKNSAKEQDVRIFKNVLLKNISKPEEESKDDKPLTKAKMTKKHKKKRKRIRVVESDASDDEKSDSSAKVFKENKKPLKTTQTVSNRRCDSNNLFNYFSKAEKNVPSVESNDSPVKCHRVVQVEALIHSPPKARRSAIANCECETKPSKTSHPSIDDARLPVVKIVRADFAKFNALDEIVEISTDFVDTSTLQKSKPKITSSTDEGELSSDNFTPSKIQPWKMRVQFVSGSKFQKRQKKSESKEKKPRDASGSVAEKKPAVVASSGVAEKKSAVAKAGADAAGNSQISVDGVEEKITVTSVYDGSGKAVTLETAGGGVEEDIIPKVATNGAEKESTAAVAVKAAEKKETDEEAVVFVEKKLTVSLARVEPNTPVKVNVDKGVLSPAKAAGFAEDKPVKKKLAPLFCKVPASKMVPPKPVDMEARRLFLESDLPEDLKQKMKEPRNFVIEENDHQEYCFPKHTHVQQVEPTNWLWNLEEVTSFNMKPIDNDVAFPEFDGIVSLVSHRKPVETGSDAEKLNVAEEIATLRKLEPNVNVIDVFSSVKKLGKEISSENGTLCWTEKYRPTTCSDLIGNTTNLLKLKEWIESHKRIRFRLSDGGDGSSDDFVDSDDSSCSVETRNNVALLAGPSGCGKTCAVYALANELGFKVLEVNAASNRNGKRILDELQEATQSHRVKRTSIFDKDTKKSKKKRKDFNKEKKTMSLILIEDADILFDNYDDGFLSALSSLTLHSKRPFIFTANNLNHPHLLKYTKSQNLVLTFAYPTVSLLNVWLRSIALNEGVRLSDEVLMYLFHVAGLDLRKSLLQLQMLISSNKYHLALSNEQLFYTDWWKQITKESKAKSVCKRTDKGRTVSQKLFSDDDDDENTVCETSDGQNCEYQIHLKSKNEREADVKALRQLANLFERIAILGSFKSANLYQPVAIHDKERSLDPSSFNSSHSQLSNDIADTIKSQIFSESCNKDPSFSFREYYGKIRINGDIKQIVDNVFCNFNPKPCNTVSKYCDYLPAIRDIARIESYKVSGQRRTSRYFSYLNSINIHVSEKETNFLSNSLL